MAAAGPSGDVFTLNKRAVVHSPTCLDLPILRAENAAGYWSEFPTEYAASVGRLRLKAQGFDVQWCECDACRAQRN